MRHQYFLAALMIVTATATPMAMADDGNLRKGNSLPDAYCAYDIGQLPGLPPGEISVNVTAINNRNQLVGWIAIADGISPMHAFIWDRKHGMRDLGSLPGHESLVATDINEAGTVVARPGRDSSESVGCKPGPTTRCGPMPSIGAIRPAAKITIDSTAAKIGRSMKNLEKSMRGSSGKRGPLLSLRGQGEAGKGLWLERRLTSSRLFQPPAAHPSRSPSARPACRA